MFACGAALTFAATLELAARLFLPQSATPEWFSPMGAAAGRPGAEFLRPQSTLFWELRPGIRHEPTFWGDVVNSEGLRMNREVGDRDGRVRVACFGDSCTYGLGLPVADAWPSILDRDAALDVINAGVPGYSSHQGALFADMRCPAWRPDVVIVEFGPNDVVPWIQHDHDRTVAFTDEERAPYVRLDELLQRSALLRLVASAAGAQRPRASVDGRGVPNLRPRVPPDEFRSNLLRIAAHAPHAVVLLWPGRRVIDPSTRDGMSADALAPYVEATSGLASDHVDFVNLGEPLLASHLTANQAFIDAIHGTRAMSDLVAAAVREKIRARLRR
jgi:hypothetical protein